MYASCGAVTSKSVTRAATRRKKADIRSARNEALISEYLGLSQSVEWTRFGVDLARLLMDSGHSVDPIDPQGDVVRMAVGRGGTSLAGKGETIGEAMVDALSGYIRFIGGAKASHLDSRIQPSRSAMPFHTALDWMKKGLRVRRSSWPAGTTLRLTLGNLSHETTVFNQCVTGVPIEHFNCKGGEHHAGEYAEPVFTMAMTNTFEFPWNFDAMSLLATDWELDS